MERGVVILHFAKVNYLCKSNIIQLKRHKHDKAILRNQLLNTVFTITFASFKSFNWSWADQILHGRMRLA